MAGVKAAKEGVSFETPLGRPKNDKRRGARRPFIRWECEGHVASTEAASKAKPVKTRPGGGETFEGTGADVSSSAAFQGLCVKSLVHYRPVKI